MDERLQFVARRLAGEPMSERRTIPASSFGVVPRLVQLT
jgi:hypothetical protein